MSETLARSFTLRYAVVTVALVLVSLAAYVVLDGAVAETDRRAGLINEAGRQRMLVQQVAVLAERLADPGSASGRTELRARMHAALDQLADNHRRLSDSPVLRREAGSLLFGPDGGIDSGLEAFIARGRAVAAGEGGDDVLDAMRRDATGVLPTALDTVVSRLERGSEALNERLRWLVLVATSAFALLALLAAVAVFRPMVQRMRLTLAERGEAEEMARASEERLWAILDESPIGVSVSRRKDGRVVFANSRFTELIQVPKEEFLGSYARDWFVDDAQRQSVIERMRSHGKVADAEVRFRRSDGAPFWTLLTVRGTTLRGEDVNLAWIYDITERKRDEERLRLSGKVIETANEAIVVTGPDNRIQAVNPAFTRITEYAAAEAVGRDPSFLASGRHDGAFYQAMWDGIAETGRWQGEVWNRRKSGAFYAQWLSIAALKDEEGRTTHHIGLFYDITHRKEDEARVWRQANYDALTQLPNRSLFQDRLSQAVRQADRDEGGFALMFIDLDGFKQVNDTHGHAAGDKLLQLAAERLRNAVRASDTAARLAGDEFTLILGGVSDADGAGEVARSVLATLSLPYVLDADEDGCGTAVTVHASIGIALFPDDADCEDDLLARADSAMYAAKRAGKNAFCFAGAHEAESWTKVGE